MSILQDLMDLTVRQCHLCAYLNTIPAEMRDEWVFALRKPVSVVGNTAVVTYLQTAGVTITEASVRRHRAKALHAT